MKSLSGEFKQALYNDERNYLVFADIVLADNTEISVSNSEIWVGGFSYEEAVSEDDNFTALGSAIIGSATLILDNTDDQYIAYDFVGATVTLYVGMQFGQRLEKIKIGVYTVDSDDYNGATLKLTLLDNLSKFDVPYSYTNSTYTTKLQYPASLFTIVKDACDRFGVTLGTPNFPNKDFTISTRPDDEATTFREVISWVATIAGCFVKCNPDGELCFKWFDRTTLENSLDNLDGGEFDGTVYHSWLIDYMNTEEGMTSLLSTTSDDTWRSVENSIGFSFNGTVSTRLYIDTDSCFAFSDTQPSNHGHSAVKDVNILTRDGQANNIKYQVISSGSESAIKVKFHGYTRYGNSYQTSEYELEYEIFFTTSGRIIINFITLPTSSTYLGTTSIVENEITNSFTPPTGSGKIIASRENNTWQTETILGQYVTGDTADGGSFNPWNTGYEEDGGTFTDGGDIHYFLSQYAYNASLDDVIITGLYVDVNDGDNVTRYSVGTMDYAIELLSNPFITTTNAQSVLNALNTQFVGLRFRKINITIPNDPSIESGDVAIVLDRKQHVHSILITRNNFAVDNAQTIVCGATTPLRNNETRFSAITKSFVQSKELVNKEKTAREQAVSNLASTIAAKAGAYTTIEAVSGGGNIFYLHDKPNLSDSSAVWMMTAEAFAATTAYNGAHPEQTVWTIGMQVNGDVIARYLSVDGINAGWIDTGTLSVENPTTHEETFFADWATGVVRIKAAEFSLQGSSLTSSWSNGGVPTNSNYPAVNWTTDAIKEKHVGDVYYDSSEAGIYKYAFMYEGLKINFSGTINYSGSDYAIIFTFKHGTKWYTITDPFPLNENFESSIFLPDAALYNNYTYFSIKLNTGVTFTLTYRMSVVYDVFPSAEEYGTSPPFFGSSLVYRNIDTDITWNQTYPGSSPLTYAIVTNTVIDSSTGIYAWKNTQAKYSQEEVFNTLTNNGALRGIYMENGQLYISFDYAKGGTLVLGGTNNGNGTLEVKNASNNAVVRLNNDGFTSWSGDVKTVINNGAINVYNGNTYYGTMQVYIPQIVGESGGVNLFSPYGIRLSVGSSLSANPTAELTLEGSQILITKGGGVVAEDIKSRLVRDTIYGDRLLYCYETPTPYFGDIGTAITDENGEAFISIDDIFDEAVNTNIEYSVFLQKEGQGDLWIEEKDYQYFIVKGTPNLKFSWEVKAVQKGYETLRLDDFEWRKSDDQDDIDVLLDEDLKMFDEELEELYE